MAINEKNIKQLIKERAKLEPEDPKAEEYSEEFADILSQNEKETTEFLSTCADEELLYLSEIFEELSYVFKSQKFVDFLRELAKGHPKAELDADVGYAAEALKG